MIGKKQGLAVLKVGFILIRLTVRRVMFAQYVTVGGCYGKVSKSICLHFRDRPFSNVTREMLNPRAIALLYFVQHVEKISLFVLSISVVLTQVVNRASYGRLNVVLAL